MARTPIVKGAKKEQQVRDMLLNRKPIRAIARDTGFSRKAIETYRDESLPEKLLKAREVEEVAEADAILGQIQALQSRTMAALALAEKAKEISMVFRGVREARENLRLLGELAGKLKNQPQINIWINNPEWIELRALIVVALDPFPNAKEAVIHAINGR